MQPMRRLDMHLEKFYFYSFRRWGDKGVFGLGFLFFWAIYNGGGILVSCGQREN
jgi:hypothetical protein